MAQPTPRITDGFQGRAFTVAEILRLQEIGLIDEDESFELVEGEIVPIRRRLSLTNGSSSP